MKHTLLIFALTLGSVVLTQPSRACTNFIVGKSASVDGSTMITYAADSYTHYGYLNFTPAADHPAGSMREVVEGDTRRPLGQIPQVSHTYRVVGYMNEHQLTIGETTWGGREALWDTTGIDYVSLMQIALERCRTAREAIDCMVQLVAEYGYASEGESFSIGDPNEVWLMDMIGKGPGRKGAVWVAQRIPDDCISAHANQARTTSIPGYKAKVKKSQRYGSNADGTVLWEKEVISLAREKGYFSGRDEDFNYAAAYNPFDFSGLYVCEARVWSFFRRFSDDMDGYFDYATGKTFLETGGRDAGEPMPLYFRPNHKVSAQDLKDCMRDQYEGTPLDITTGTDAGPWNSKLRYGGLTFTCDSTKYWYERPTATQQTANSFVAQMRGYESAKAGGIFWFAVDDAATSLYVPMYSAMTDIPECYRLGNGDLYTYSETSAWWLYNIVANWVYTKYSRMKPDLDRVQKTWEDRFNAQVDVIDQKIGAMSPAEAQVFLTKYSIDAANKSCDAWRELRIYLFTKYLDGVERKEENGQFVRNPYGNPVGPNRVPYPASFQKTIIDEVAHE